MAANENAIEPDFSCERQRFLTTLTLIEELSKLEQIKVKSKLTHSPIVRHAVVSLKKIVQLGIAFLPDALHDGKRLVQEFTTSSTPTRDSSSSSTPAYTQFPQVWGNLLRFMEKLLPAVDVDAVPPAFTRELKAIADDYEDLHGLMLSAIAAAKENCCADAVREDILREYTIEEYNAYARAFGHAPVSRGHFEAVYIGQFDDVEDFVRSQLESSTAAFAGLPDYLKNRVDYDGIYREDWAHFRHTNDFYFFRTVGVDLLV